MDVNKSEVQLKAKATNWLISTLILVVGWVGKEQYNALQEISKDLKAVAVVVQVHDEKIKRLEVNTAALDNRMMQMIIVPYQKQFAKREDPIEFPKRRNIY